MNSGVLFPEKNIKIKYPCRISGYLSILELNMVLGTRKRKGNLFILKFETENSQDYPTIFVVSAVSLTISDWVRLTGVDL